MALNAREQAVALIRSKFQMLERQLVEKFRGCTASTGGVRRGLGLGFVGDKLFVVQRASSVATHISEADLPALIASSSLVGELIHNLQEAVQELPVGYQEAVREVAQQVDNLRGLDTTELAE